MASRKTENFGFLKKSFFLFMLLLSFVNCNSDKKLENNEKAVIVSQGGSPKSLDPHLYNEIPGLFVAKQIYDTLLSLDSEGNIIPELAENYQYLSDHELKITLKKGVKFHNGEELKASDVAFSINRMKEKPGSKIMIDDIDTVKILDDYSVVLILKQPSAALLFSLAYPLTSILNEKDVKSKNDDINISPVGTGPFKFVTWENRDQIELVANYDYFKGKPKIDKLIFVTIPENSSRMIALETGEIHIATGMSTVEIPSIEGNSSLYLISEPTSSTENMMINLKRDKFSKKEVRQAINYAIDKKSILDALFSGKGQVANSMINPKVFGSYQGGKQYDFNPEKARELLKSVGMEKGLTVKLWVNSGNATRIQAAQIIQSNLKDVGINTNIEILEWSSYLQNSANGGHDLLLGGWISGTLDADIVLFPLYHSSSLGGAGNRSFYINPVVDKLIEKGRLTSNMEERKEIYKEAQIILNEDLPIIPLFYKNENIGISNKIKNFKYNPTLIHTLYQIDKE